MKKLIAVCIGTAFFISCQTKDQKQASDMNDTAKKEFNYMADRFADIQVLRYNVPGWEDLSVKEKQLAYYLYQAGLSGRDIFYDQKYKHNLRIRKTLEAILETYKGDKNSDDYKKFEEYCRRFFFSNGIHHHYSGAKFIPECSAEYFAELVKNSDQSRLPLEGKSVDEFRAMIQPLIFDPAIAPKTVDLTAGVDHVKASSNNFYEGVTEKEVEKFYADMKKANPDDKSWLGLNSKLVKENGKIVEKRWMVGGMYSPSIEKIVHWLDKATTVAENDRQKQTLEKLIKFYRSGDPKDFDEYSISWVKDTASRFDLTNGFIEVYQDALQKRGSYESIVAMKDLEATKRIAAIAREAQWFEDNSTIMDEHKKKDVKGISAKVITVIGEVGDAAPSTPIGINLPNNEWIRESPEHGSKSVSLGNIVAAYNYAKSKSPVIVEFGASDEVKERVKKYGALSSDLHTDMHEVIGHASGQRNKGVGPSDETLKTYAGVLEEARADLVALYYIMDQKLVDIGVMPSLEVGKAQYDSYLMNGMMTQLNRIKLGDKLEQAHMRNRQLNSAWVIEKGKADKSVEMVKRDGNTYIVINDYNKVRQNFGALLREMQRIKSEGDYEAGKNLVETYGVKIDPELHKEVLARYEKLDVAPYMGFIQPKLIPVMNGDSITDVKVEYPESFIGQHLEYGKEYGYLPVTN
jgi:dipeptidyl-peptidase III